MGRRIDGCERRGIGVKMTNKNTICNVITRNYILMVIGPLRGSLPTASSLSFYIYRIYIICGTWNFSIPMLGKAALWRLQMKLRSFFERPKRLHFEFALGSQG